ncbi:ATPase, V1/A1 complex, subunit E [Gorgonomyces haynaldii]|nr:ATPase, V1/A1 complex, subunit E [Gorgonomyces haynaldii]
MAGKLSDNEVAQEMNKMVAFIKQEALEKAREIKIKADEEFNIEKGKLVRQETVNIEAFFQKKLKQADVQRKIQHSHLINKNRLKVLQARQQILQDLFSEAKSKLVSITDGPHYGDLLTKLSLQGFYQLMEKKVSIQARPKDYPILEQSLKEAQRIYQEKLGLTIEPTIDKANPLPDNSYGGVVISAVEGRIRSNNTLETRLELLSEQMLPEIRLLLFGPSLSRKFFN